MGWEWFDGLQGNIWQSDGAWSDELSFSLWWMRSFSYGHAFPTGFYMATSFNEASEDVMGLLFFCPSFFLPFFIASLFEGKCQIYRSPNEACGGLPRPLRADARAAGIRWRSWPMATSDI